MTGKTIQEESAQGFDTAHWPGEIRYLSKEKQLLVTFDNGESFTYPAEFLRVESPSAEVQGHGCLLYTSPSPRDRQKSRMPSSA